jgi:MFS family permease
MPLHLADTFISFRHRNYRLFFLGQTISLVGTWMQSVAQSWLVLLLTNSAFMLGLVGALGTLPILLFSFWAGVIADHTDRRRLLIFTNSAGLLLALILGILVVGHWVALWHIMVLAFGLGTTMAFDIPGRQSFIVELVGKSDLPNAIALNSGLFNGTRILGPAMAGLLIASVGLANCFFLNALSFLAPLVGLTLMRLDTPAVSRPVPRIWTSMRELHIYLRIHSELFWIMIIMSATSIFALSYMVLMPKIARDILGSGVQGYGFLMTATGLGAFMGALALANRIRHHPPMFFFVGGNILLCLALFIFSCIHNYYWALLFLFLAGFGMSTQVSSGNSLIQLNVPDELRGRVMSLFSLTFVGSIPLGSILFGTLAHYWDTCLTVRLGAGTAGVLTLVIFWRVAKLRKLDFREMAYEGKSGEK